MRILIFGGDGQLGRAIQTELALGDCGFVSVDKNECDIASFDQCRDQIDKTKPSIIVNCAAHTGVDACEENFNQALTVNAHGARNIAVAAFETEVPIMHFSTDYVFDGLGSAPYAEWHVKNPINAYGVSKSVGEDLVAATNPRHFIVRTAWLYGDGHNFVRTIVRKIKNGEPLSIVDDQIGTPTSCKELAKAACRLMQTGQYGIYHAVCKGCCSWYDLAREIVTAMNANVHLVPIKTSALNLPAKRPKYSVLGTAMLDSLSLSSFLSWQEALHIFLQEELSQ